MARLARKYKRPSSPRRGFPDDATLASKASTAKFRQSILAQTYAGRTTLAFRMIPTDWTGNDTWVPMATVHFAAMTGALLAGWMGCGLRASAFNVNRVNATDLWLLVRP